MPEMGSYYYGVIESIEPRKTDKNAFHVVVKLTGGDAADYWTSLAFLHINTACNVTVLSQLDARGNFEESRGTTTKYRFLDHKTIEVKSTNITSDRQNFEEPPKTTRKKYHLEKLYLNPKLRSFRFGPHVEAPDEDGWTPLKWAAQVGDFEAAREYLDKHVSVDAKDKYGRTPLMWASEKGHTGIVNILLRKGADAHAKDKDGWSSLLAASQDGHIEVVKLLLENGSDINERDKDNCTHLMAAAYSGHEATIKLLIEKGADINAKDKSGMTALMIASKNGHAQIVELLKAHGAKK